MILTLLAALGFELKTSQLVGRHSTTWTTPPTWCWLLQCQLMCPLLWFSVPCSTLGILQFPFPSKNPTIYVKEVCFIFKVFSVFILGRLSGYFVHNISGSFFFKKIFLCRKCQSHTALAEMVQCIPMWPLWVYLRVFFKAFFFPVLLMVEFRLSLIIGSCAVW
jgi:hypothetical protein